MALPVCLVLTVLNTCLWSGNLFDLSLMKNVVSMRFFEPNVKDQLLILVVRESKDEFMWIISFEREIISNYLLVTTSLPADQGQRLLTFCYAVTENAII